MDRTAGTGPHWGMTVTDPAPDLRAPVRSGSWAPWAALALAVLGAAAYVVALVMPYYVHDLHRRPAGESLYLYELAGLWPYDTALGGLVAILGMWAFSLGPFVAFGVAAWSGHRLWTSRERRAVTAIALLVSLATLAWVVTPLNAELMAWFVD
jgi:hypothetical protein